MRVRRNLIAPLAVTAAAASVLAVAVSTGPALAGPSAAGRYHHRACAASQLSMTVPKAIAGDPIEGMGELAWNILLRNISNAGCSLAGWPSLSVTAAKTPAAITSQDVSFSNLAQVRAQRIVLAAGQQAVVTVQASDNTAGCQARWRLTLRLPGGAGSLTTSQLAESFGPCGGGLLRLSPFYPRSSLARAIRQLHVAQSPPPYRTTRARTPAPCTAQRMRVAASYGLAGHHASVQVLRLVSRGPGACVLAGEWPTITLRSAGGASQIAKALAVLPRGVTRSPLVGYQQAHSVKTDLTLSRGRSASIALETQTTGRAACHLAATARIYPGLTALGTSLAVGLARPLTFCGLPRVLPFLAGRPSAGALMAEAQALGGGMIPDGDSPAGFWYGSDSNSPVPTSSSGGVWLMPHSPTGGDYGGYVGELGDYEVWQGCGGSINWNQTGYNDAEGNLRNHSVGVGVAGYWMMAGPGREPGGYSSSGTTATNWGTSQAERAVSDVSQTLGFPYIFMDIEAADPHGWNEGFNGVCSGTETAGSIPVTLDRDTFNGFWNYVNNSSAFFPSVYEAGGSGGSSWDGIFGSGQTLGNTLEWTYVNETPSVSTFPAGWSVSGTVPVWYASAPSQCQMMWQWSGGDGVLNQYRGDFDQIDGNRLFSCA